MRACICEHKGNYFLRFFSSFYSCLFEVCESQRIHSQDNNDVSLWSASSGMKWVCSWEQFHRRDCWIIRKEQRQPRPSPCSLTTSDGCWQSPRKQLVTVGKDGWKLHSRSPALEPEAQTAFCSMREILISQCWEELVCWDAAVSKEQLLFFLPITLFPELNIWPLSFRIWMWDP